MQCSVVYWDFDVEGFDVERGGFRRRNPQKKAHVSSFVPFVMGVCFCPYGKLSEVCLLRKSTVRPLFSFIGLYLRQFVPADMTGMFRPAVRKCVFSVCVCLLLQDLVQRCLRGGGGIWEDMCYETSPGLCGLDCPSRTSERGGEGDCVKEGGGGEGKCERERALTEMVHGRARAPPRQT
jgi:hypothetical protein